MSRSWIAFGFYQNHSPSDCIGLLF